MSPAVEAGHDILIPLFDGETAKVYKVNWSQNLSSRNAEYYCVTADNITLGTRKPDSRCNPLKDCADNYLVGTQFPLFIAAEFYKTSTSANPKHITKVGQLQPGGACLMLRLIHVVISHLDVEGYKIKVNSELQYGQKNAAGELRFVVYHDKERKPYQVSAFSRY